MDVQEAIKRAKDVVSVAFADEDVAQVRTEELEFDPERNAWSITLGLMRPAIDTRAGQVPSLLGKSVLGRSCETFSVKIGSGAVDAGKIKLFDE